MKYFSVVILGLGGKDTYTYKGESYKRGDIVLVPFRRGVKKGLVLGEDKPYKGAKGIIKKLLELPENIVELGLWLADYYASNIGQSFSHIVPQVYKSINEFSPEFSRGEGVILTPAQEKLAKSIIQNIERGRRKDYLLFGVTGSGKTEIYLRIMEYVIEMGMGVIYLVPEIALVPQTIERIGERLPFVVEYHSKMTGKERYSNWMHIKEGRAKIVVGARMAIFSPVQNLGLIIVDEEHSTSYKEEEKPPLYNARDVAIFRGRMERASVILGSATPSVESYFRAKEGEYVFMHLPERIGKKYMPEIEVVDMKKERSLLLSERLEQEIIDAYNRKEQVLLFINRRGYAPYLYCRNCGRVIICPRCSVSMTYHKTENKLICHHCGYTMDVPDRCPYCGGKLVYKGAGTERVFSYINRKLGIQDMVRVDSDTVSKRGSHRLVYESIKSGKVGVIVGTQMITKGLDIPAINIVGIISADTSLNFPDFRSNERTFQLIMQAAGRCGRGEQRGKVIIQTLNPENFAISAVARYDYERFYKEELAIRKRVGYPPFIHLGRIILNGKDEEKVREAAYNIFNKLNNKDLEILGPSPAPISKIRGKFYYHLLLKSEDRNRIIQAMRDVLKLKLGSIKLKVDPDPVSMM